MTLPCATAPLPPPPHLPQEAGDHAKASLLRRNNELAIILGRSQQQTNEYETALRETRSLLAHTTHELAQARAEINRLNMNQMVMRTSFSVPDDSVASLASVGSSSTVSNANMHSNSGTPTHNSQGHGGGGGGGGTNVRDLSPTPGPMLKGHHARSEHAVRERPAGPGASASSNAAADTR